MSFNLNNGISQNLVKNPNFEEYFEYPNALAQWYKCVGWHNLNGATAFDLEVHNGSPDYFHRDGSGDGTTGGTVFAQVSPYSGKAIMGAIARVRESVQV